MSSKPKSNFFRPPPETFSMFDDLVDEDEDANNQNGEEPQVSSLSDHGFNTLATEPSYQDQDQDKYGGGNANEDEDEDAPAVFLNKFRHCKPPKNRRFPKHIRNSQYNAASRQYIVQAPPSRAQQERKEEEYYFRSAPPLRRLPEPYPVHAPTRIHTAGGGEISILNTSINVFMSGAQRKRIEQLERIEKAESDLRMLLREGSHCSANEKTKLRGKLLHIQACRNKLENGGAEQVLNGSEVKMLYEVGRQVERRQVVNEGREFERLARGVTAAAATTTAGGRDGEGRETTGKGKKRARPKDTVYEDYGSRRAATAMPSLSSTYHPTMGGKTIPQDELQSGKRQRLGSVDIDDDDDEEEDAEEVEDEQKRMKYGFKTIGKGQAFDVSRYDVDAALRADVEEEEETEEHEADDEGESEDDGDDSSESSESSDDSDADEEVD